MSEYLPIYLQATKRTSAIQPPRVPALPLCSNPPIRGAQTYVVPFKPINSRLTQRDGRLVVVSRAT